jgi:hypothetical protein
MLPLEGPKVFAAERSLVLLAQVQAPLIDGEHFAVQIFSGALPDVRRGDL